MALRLQCTYYANENGTEYTISVYDEEYVGSVVDFSTDSEGFVINWQGEETSMKVPVLSSKCDVTILVDSAAIETFITDINTAYEGQLRMAITSGATGIWYGHILPDLVQIEDKPLDVTYNFRLTATDGIKRMQTLPYKDTSAPYTGEETIIGHLLNCIGKIGLTDLMGTTVLKSVTNWVPIGIIAGDVMLNSSFEHRALYRIDDKGNYKYNSVYRIIEQLCFEFQAQFKMMNGAYWFYQHNEYENNTVTAYQYQANGTAVGTAVSNTYFSVDSVFTGKFGNGNYTFFPPLNYAQVNYIHFGYINLAQGYIWYELDQPTIPEAPTVYRVNDNTSFIFRANLHYTISATGTKPKYSKFDLTFKVDTNYLQRDSNGGNGAIYNAPQAISAVADTFELTLETPVIQYDPLITPIGQGDIPIEFTTIDFPTGGTFTFTLDFAGCYDLFGVSIGAGLSVLWKFSNVQVIPVSTNDVSNYTNTTSVTAYNATTGNSEKSVINTIVGQSLGYGKIRVDDGISGIDGIDWGVGATSLGQTLEELIAIETIRTQSVPIKKMKAQFISSSYTPIQSLRHGSNDWIFYKGKWHSNKEYFEAEWRLLNTSGTTSGNTNVNWVIDGVDQDGNDIITIVQPGGGTPDPGSDNSADPNNPGVNSVLNALFPRTIDDIDNGATVTTVPIETRTVAGEYKAGQTITLIDPYSGAQQSFTVTQDSAISDTVINVSSTTANFTFPEGSWIVTSQETQGATGGSSASYRQEFATHASATITVTAGTLPTNAAAIRLYYDNGQVISPTYWSHSANVITLTYTPPGNQSIWVEFTT